MYLATVTCYRDFPQLLLQAESIQKFVEPCKHVILVNHDNPDLEFYYRWLTPYYTKHELVIIPKFDYYYPVKGLHTNHVIIGTALEWRIQQLQKLLLAYEFEEDYLLLDSKNFFIKPTNLSYWENMLGSGKLTTDRVNDYFSQTGDVYRKLFNVTDTQVFSPATPFKIDRELLTSRCTKEALGYFLYAPEFNERVVSEFIFYSVLINDEIKKCTYWPSKHIEGVLWQHDLEDLHTRLMQTQNNPDLRISGFHRNLLGKVDTRQLSMINSWLKFAIGLNNTLQAIPLDPEMSAHDIKQLPKH